MKKRKPPIKMYQMGTPNLVPQGTQKAITDTASNINQTMSNNFNTVKNIGQDFLNTQKEGYNKIGNTIGGFFKGKKFFNKGTSSVKGNPKPKKYQAGIAEAASAVLSNPQAQQMLMQMAPQLLGSMGSMGGGFNNQMQGGLTASGAGLPGNVGDVIRVGGKLISRAIDRRQEKMDLLKGRYTDMYGRPYLKKNGSKFIKYQEGANNLENKTRFQNFMSGDIRKTSTGNLIGTLPTSYNEAKVPLAETMPEGRKPIVTLQNYKENKGGYARALKSGIIDENGYLVDPQTGYTYKNLNTVKRKSSTISTKNVPATKVKKSTTPPIIPTPTAKMTGNELVLMSKMGKPFSLYTIGGLPNPIPRTEVKVPVQKKETTKVDNRRVYPEESPLAKYRKGIPSKPATNIPTKVMDYKAQNLSTSRKAELAKNLANYGMISPFSPSGSSNMYTPFFETIHNTRFKKK